MSDIKTVEDADTLQAYDRWSRSYDGEPNPLMAATAWVLDQAPLDCRGLDVIELGCGTGRNAERVLAEGARSYTGVDGSAGMLAVARSRFAGPRSAAEGQREGEEARQRPIAASWLEADLRAEWRAPRVFDLALVVLVIEHLPELATFARTLAGAARRIRIVELHPAILGGGTVAHFTEGQTEVRFPSVAHPVRDLSEALERAGFTVAIREWIADDTMIAGVPKIAKHRGKPVVLDVAGFCARDV